MNFLDIIKLILSFFGGGKTNTQTPVDSNPKIDTPQPAPVPVPEPVLPKPITPEEMKLKVIRSILDSKSTIGDLLIDEVYECHTLEDTVREIAGKPVSSWKIPNETAIPYGTYKVIIDYSNRFKKDMPHVLDVPGFDGIRIHSGNVAADTEGCLLLGNKEGVDEIEDSKVAFNNFFPKLEAAFNAKKNITITYVKKG